MSEKDPQLFPSEEIDGKPKPEAPLSVRKNASSQPVSSSTPPTPTPVKRPPKKKKRWKRKKKMSVKERRSLIHFLIVFSGIMVVSLILGLALRFTGTRYELFIASEVSTNREFVRSFATELPESAMLFDVFTEIPQDDHTLYQISYGTSVSQICQDLSELGILGTHSAQDLLDLLVANSFDTGIRAGSYLFPKNLNLQTIGLILYKGFSDLAVVSLYDGLTIAGIDDHLSGKGIIVSGEFIEASTSIADRYGLNFSEGFFLPDDYVVPITDTSAEQLAQVMYLTCRDLLIEHKDRLDLLGQTESEILIIASMIQRETANTKEMPLISGIINNRLICSMPLGIDATTRYETDNWSRPITSAELSADTPYNTRNKSGLPPTGIANPGVLAILAAFYPDDTPYFYYLHDKSGQIHPAVTYADHLENVQKYLR